MQVRNMTIRPKHHLPPPHPTPPPLWALKWFLSEFQITNKIYLSKYYVTLDMFRIVSNNKSSQLFSKVWVPHCNLLSFPKNLKYMTFLVVKN